MTTLKLRLKDKRKPQNPRIRFCLEKLNDPEIAEIFQAKVGGKFAALSILDSEVDTLASEIKEVLLTTAEEVLGRKRRKTQPWVTNEVLDLCDRRRELKGKKHTSDEARANYQKAHREVRTKMRAAKEEWIEKQCNDIEKGMEAGNSKQAYSTLKALTKTSQPRANIIDNKDGKPLTDSEEVLKRWTEYCSSLYNYELHPDTSILQANQAPTESSDSPPVMKEEVEAAV